MVKLSKNAAICAIVIFCLISTVVFSADISVLKYDNALLQIDGVHLVVNSSSSTVQGLFDVSIKNIDVSSFDFCVKYDTDYLALSDFTNNKELTLSDGTRKSDDSFYRDGAFFGMNTDAFPDGAILDQYTYIPGLGAIRNWPLSCADFSNGYFSMSFTPAAEIGEYIGYVGEELHIIADNDTGVTLGQISFLVKNPEELSKLPQEKLETLVEIVPFWEMYGKGSPQAGNSDDCVRAKYMELNEDGVYVERFDNDIKIGYGVNISTDFVSIEPYSDKFTVTAYDLYKSGTDQDLYDFLNERATVVETVYSDGSRYPAKITWNRDNSSYTGFWDPKGGTYEFSYKYYFREQEFHMTVQVEVLPVTLLGFDVDNQSITYVKDAPDFPSSVLDLDLPTKARPILDRVLLNGGIPAQNISSYTGSGKTFTLDGGVPSQDAIDYMQMFTQASNTTVNTITCMVENAATLSNTYPWLTVSDISSPTVERNIVVLEGDDLSPLFEITASAHTDDDGVMEIKVKSADGSNMDENTKFEIRLPSGELIDTSAEGITYEVSYSGDTATIKLSADIELAENAAKAINLGERLGKFSITAVREQSMMGDVMNVKSPTVLFTSNPRKNQYLAPTLGSDTYYDANTYVFDYSLSYAALMPVKSGSSLPTTVELPLSEHRVGTTYDGYDGGEPGGLSAFTVESWSEIDDTDGVITVEGVLLDGAAYTNYGTVNNDGGIKVRIKYCETDDTNPERIVIRPTSFVYNTQQVGYDYDRLQKQSFRVTNNGVGDIYNITVKLTLASSNGGNVEAFIVTKTLPLILHGLESAEIDISTKIGLPVGKYTASAEIYSADRLLGKIDPLVFEVVEAPVYKIDMKVETPSGEDCDYGTAETESGVYTQEAGKEVKAVATAESEDYKFLGWKTDNETLKEYLEGKYHENISGDYITAEEITFDMPAEDITLTAVFDETIGAKLRADELYVLANEELNDSKDNGLPLMDESWQEIVFDPATREYYVVVPNDTDAVNLWFKLKEADEVKTSDKSVKNTVYDEGGTASPAVSGTIDDPADDDYYKTSALTLEVGPSKNVIELSFTYNDIDGEGEVTREYKINVYRKIAESDRAVFAYGNSPFGRIMRDDTLTDGSDKSAKQQAFVDDGYIFKSADYVPSGSIADYAYTEAAWTGVNYDTDNYALFTVLKDDDSALYDSGYITLKNSLGKDVTANGLSHKRVTLRTLKPVGNGNAADFSDMKVEVAELGDDGDISELKAYRIRPGIYDLEYIYEDYNGENIVARKPLIVLYPPGDVDINKKTEDTDAKRIRERYKSGEDIANEKVAGFATGSKVYRHRILDVNADGYVSMLDSNGIERILKGLNRDRYINITQTEYNETKSE